MQNDIRPCKQKWDISGVNALKTLAKFHNLAPWANKM